MLDVRGNARLATLAEGPPGPEAMRFLTSYDPATLDAPDRVALLVAWERQLAWAQAQQQAVLAAVAGDRTRGDWGREEVAAALRLSTATAQRRIDVARALNGRLLRTARLLASGAISYWHAAAVADAVACLDDLTAHAVESAVLPRLPRRTVAETRRALRAAVIAADPATALERRERALRHRGIERWTEPDGMAVLVARMADTDAALVFAALDRLATRAGPDDDRLVGARRVDALVALCRGGAPGRLGASRATVNVTVDLHTLLGLADRAAYVDGVGPVPPQVARDLARGARWRRFVTDPCTGELLDRSPRTYRPSRALAAFVVARDQVCRFPGCNQPAPRGDVDHHVPFDLGGPTTRANLGALCRRHHRLKHEGGWRLRRHGERLVWHSPAGQRYDADLPGYPLRT